jgi:hypothetical protein
MKRLLFALFLALSLTGCGEDDGCCKYCDEGKACGDTCISRSSTCHEGSGCACNS